MKALKIILIIFGLLIILIAVGFFVLNSIVNQENLTYNFKHKILKTETLMDKLKSGENYVIIIGPSCPYNSETVPILKNNLELMKENKIGYFIFADDLYGDYTDKSIDELKKQYQIDETIYLMDFRTYSDNEGLMNIKQRYKEFVKDLTNRDDIPLGYVQYLKFIDGKFIGDNHGAEVFKELSKKAKK